MFACSGRSMSMALKEATAGVADPLGPSPLSTFILHDELITIAQIMIPIVNGTERKRFFIVMPDFIFLLLWLPVIRAACCLVCRVTPHYSLFALLVLHHST